MVDKGSIFQIDPRESEAKLIISAISQNALHKLGSAGIDPDCLLVWGDVLKFVTEHWQKYDKPPELETVSMAFPDFPCYEKDSYDMGFLLDIAIENGQKKKLKKYLIEAMSNIGDKDALDIASSLLTQIPGIGIQGKTRTTYVDDNPEVRLEQYKKRKELVESGKRLGIGTGINALDKEGICYVPGDFVLIVGPPEIGKSWLLLKSCATAYLAGKRVLFVSPEMCEEDVSMRLYPIIAHEWGFHLSNEALLSGHGINEKDYFEVLKRVGSNRRFAIVDDIEGGDFTVPKLEALIREHKPDIIGFDSLILMTASDGSKAINWSPLLEVAYGIKFLAVRTKTSILATHATEAGTFDTTTPATLGELGVGKYVAYALDLGISMAKSKKEKTRNIRMMKKRKGKGVSDILSMQLDPDCGRIG